MAAASFKGGVVTNGMSEKARAERNINGGLLVSVTPEDFDGLFGGMEFQEKLEKVNSGGAFYSTVFFSFCLNYLILLLKHFCFTH